jgi:hypothetical protein
VPTLAQIAELDFARRHADRYALYRVYDVLREPRFFALEGDINNVLELTAMTYSAQIAAATPVQQFAEPGSGQACRRPRPVRTNK